MSDDLVIKNRQRKFPVNMPLLQELGLELLPELADDFDLCVYLVRASEITRLNKTFLGHVGPTDVITFDYAANAKSDHCRSGRHKHAPTLHGEIFICVDEAAAQARRFHTRWESELLRYFIHGLLHLRGFDDGRSADRQRMKREEDRLLRKVEERAVSQLAKRGSAPRKTKRRPRLAA